MKATVVVEHRNCHQYPGEKYGYAPSVKYPEYCWEDIASERNEVYDMVRDALHLYGLDQAHYDTSAWNPLGDIIKHGDTVLIKPNWVMHYNENSSGGLDCLFTNTSVTRAMIDYVSLALKGSGKIYVADSAMPDCNFDQFVKVAHLDILKRSCEERGIQIEIKDLRGDIVKTFSKERIITTEAKGTEVDLGRDSYFVGLKHPKNSLRYSFLDAKKMNEYYHTDAHHRYVISDIALAADVIINLPKIKTHRKAGYTAALKNYIGICFRKDAIPHFVKGNKVQGGDEFYGPKVVFQTESNIRDKENYFENKQNRTAGLALKALRIPFWLFRRAFATKYQGVGNWHGNDTIWRAVLDINKIIYYADKKGVLRDIVQRRFFSLGDMIIAGERNGPLSPSPKQCGCIVCSENPVAFDKVVLKLMGFEQSRVPLFMGIRKEKKYCLCVENDDNICVLKNGILQNLSDVEMISQKAFQPADGWKNILK